MPDTESQIADFRARVAAMRSVGCVEWDGIRLAPESAQQADDTDTQPVQMSAQDLEMQRRREMRRVALKASGSLLSRLGDGAHDIQR